MAESSRKGKRFGARLTESDVLAIRRAYAEGNTTQDLLANRYGVSQSTINAVLQRRTWKDVGCESEGVA
jgi:uncharacterized protein YjcR